MHVVVGGKGGNREREREGEREGPSVTPRNRSPTQQCASSHERVMIGAVNYVGGRSLPMIESFLTMLLPTNDHSVARGFSFLPFLPPASPAPTC